MGYIDGGFTAIFKTVAYFNFVIDLNIITPLLEGVLNILLAVRSEQIIYSAIETKTD